MLHARSNNPSGRIRYMNNKCVSLWEPFNFNRLDSNYNVIEEKCRSVIGDKIENFKITSPRVCTPDKSRLEITDGWYLVIIYHLFLLIDIKRSVIHCGPQYKTNSEWKGSKKTKEKNTELKNWIGSIIRERAGVGWTTQISLTCTDRKDNSLSRSEDGGEV